MKFDSEAAMCAAFIAALPEGWTAYAETGGWDILLVRDADGLQIGVEAKKRLGFEVINQALKGWIGQKEGPDHRAVLVPSGYIGGELTEHLGIAVVHVVERERWKNGAPGEAGRYEKFATISPALPDGSSRGYFDRKHWPDWAPEARCKLPEYVPDVPAGTSAPVQLTDWKIGALRIIHIIERFGSVTRTDFRELRIDAGRWMAAGGWLTHGAERGQWVVGKHCPDFKAQHPVVYAQIVADFEKWCPPSRKPLVLA